MGGQLTATHNRKVTTTSESSGTDSGSEDGYSWSNSTSVNKTVSESSLAQRESSRYQYTSSGHQISGSAETISTQTFGLEIQASNHGKSTWAAPYPWESIANDGKLSVNFIERSGTTTTESFGRFLSQSTGSDVNSRFELKYDNKYTEDWREGDTLSLDEHKRIAETLSSGPGSPHHVGTLHFWGTGPGEVIATEWDSSPSSPPYLPEPYYWSGWDYVDVEFEEGMPYAKSWDARAHYDFNNPPQQQESTSRGGPTPDPGSVSAGIDGGGVARSRPALASKDWFDSLGSGGKVIAGARRTADPSAAVEIAEGGGTAASILTGGVFDAIQVYTGEQGFTTRKLTDDELFWAKVGVGASVVGGVFGWLKGLRWGNEAADAAAAGANVGDDIADAARGAEFAKPAVVAVPDVGEAAARLGVKLDQIRVVDGVAEIAIDYNQAFNRADFMALADHLKKLGASSARIDTGIVINQGYERVLKRHAQSGSTFFGARVNRLPDVGPFPRFELIFGSLNP